MRTNRVSAPHSWGERVRLISRSDEGLGANEVFAKITDDELTRLMAECVDENGVDVALERETAAMSPEARQQSQENLRRFVADVRDQIRKQHG